MTPTQTIERLEALLEKATKGHWKAHPSCVSSTRDHPDEPHAQWAFICGPYAPSFCFEAAMHEKAPNLEVIAALKNAAPLLLAQARQAETANACITAWREYDVARLDCEGTPMDHANRPVVLKAVHEACQRLNDADKAFDQARATTDRLAKEIQP